MTADDETAPKYDSEHVGRAVLLAVVDLHPVHLTVPELSLRIAADPDDSREVATIANAADDLSGSGLVRQGRDNQCIEPTLAAVRAVALLSL